MSVKQKEKVEYRYYEMPADSHILALTGEKWIQTYGRNIDYLHFHNYLEIGYCYYGTGELVLEETAYQFQGGWFSIIPAGALHTTNSTPDTISRWEYLYIDVDNCVKEYYQERPHGREQMISRINGASRFLPEQRYPSMGGLIRCILKEMTEKQENYRDYVKGAVMQLLIEISRMNAKSDVKVSMAPQENYLAKKANYLNNVIEYIHINYANPIQISQLAKVCCISEAHFRRVFMENFHMGALEYLNRTRIHAACDMLRKTDSSITEIARRVGYGTLSTFNRNFQRYVGTTPYEWRERPENYTQKLLKYTCSTEKGW